MKDLAHNIGVEVLLAPKAAITDNTDYENIATPVSLAGFSGGTIVLATGTDADVDAVFSVKVWEGDAADGSDKAAVSVDDLIIDAGLDAVPEDGFQCAFDFADDAKSFRIGYKGSKTYLGITVSPANNAGNLFVSAVVVKSHPHHAPVA